MTQTRYYSILTHSYFFLTSYLGERFELEAGHSGQDCEALGQVRRPQHDDSSRTFHYSNEYRSSLIMQLVFHFIGFRFNRGCDRVGHAEGQVLISLPRWASFEGEHLCRQVSSSHRRCRRRYIFSSCFLEKA